MTVDQCCGLLKGYLKSWLSEIVGKAEAVGNEVWETVKDSRLYALRLSVLLGMISFVILACSVTRSGAEGKDSSTFSLCCLQREAHQSAPVYVSETEKSWRELMQPEARRSTAARHRLRNSALVVSELLQWWCCPSQVHTLKDSVYAWR